MKSGPTVFWDVTPYNLFCLLPAGFLLGLLFDLEERPVGFHRTTRRYIPEGTNNSSVRWNFTDVCCLLTALKLETVRLLETSVNFYQATQRHIITLFI
jgi:hypothetical protein